MPEAVIEEQVMEQPIPSAAERLSQFLPGAPEVAPAATEAPVAEGAPAPEGQPAPVAAPTPVEGTPAAPVADPNAELLAKVGALEKQIADMSAELPDDNGKRILAIANAGPEELESYLALRNTDYSKMSLLDKLQARFMENPYLKDKSSEQRLNIFHDDMSRRYDQYDPQDPNLGYPEDSAARLEMEQHAGDWAAGKETQRKEKLLQYENKPAPKGPEPFTQEDHDGYAKRLADAYTNTKTISFKDKEGNQFDVPAEEVDGFHDNIKSDLLTVGPSAWLNRELTEEDQKGRRVPHPEKVMELVAKVSAIPALISKVKAETEARVRQEYGEKKNQQLEEIVDDRLGIRGKEAPQAQNMDINARLQAALDKQRFHT